MPGLTPEPVRAFIDSQLARVSQTGYEVESCFSPERSDGVRNVQHGGIVLVLGSFAMFTTYAFAGNFGGHFVIA